MLYTLELNRGINVNSSDTMCTNNAIVRICRFILKIYVRIVH